MTHHFVQRCRERGIASIDGMALRRNIERAIAEAEAIFRGQE